MLSDIALLVRESRLVLQRSRCLRQLAARSTAAAAKSSKTARAGSRLPAEHLGAEGCNQLSDR